MDLEVARGQGGEVGLNFLLAQVLGRDAPDFLQQQFALLFFRAGELGAASHQLEGFVVQRAEQQVFEAVPQLVAGGLGIDKSVQGEQGEGFGRLHLLGELPDDRRVIQVAALRDAGHQQVVLDDEPQSLGGGVVEVEAFGDAEGQVAAGLGVVAVAVGLANVVEEQGQVEDEGPLQLLEEGGVSGVG